MKKRVLLYDCFQLLPIPVLDVMYRKNWTLTTNKSQISKSDLIFFHLPSLVKTPYTDIDKKAGQLWIGWKYETEEWLIEETESVWERNFDFYLSFFPYNPSSFYLICKNFIYPGKVDTVFFSEILDCTRKVDFMIIGTQKGGSTSLHKYLSQHPHCRGSLCKETGYFLYPFVYKQGIWWYIKSNWSKKGIPFRDFSDQSDLLFEASTAYCFWPEVTARLYQYNPRLKFIFLLRDPVKRAISQYNMLIGWSKQQLMYEYCLHKDQAELNRLIDMLLDTDRYPFEYWINREMQNIEQGTSITEVFFPDFLKRGFYFSQLKRYYDYFPISSMLVLDSADLKNDRTGTLQRIEDFLGVPQLNWKGKDLTDSFVGEYHVKISSDLINKLYDFFAPYNQQLYRLINRDFNWNV